ncbi:DNA-3-methyladenine glycosylase family protein [Pseudarthrobacter sp. J1763]|uniref:DNA-3-methyladenine glycosylase family protein n=1 Tax=Pseudarthrobacter sp. J1763 TaxID=3420445 RepID=UPI003D2BC630
MSLVEPPSAVADAADGATRWVTDGPYDLHQTLGILLRSNSDPSIAVHPDGWWMAFSTVDGPVTLRLVQGPPEVSGAQVIDAQAWGPGAASALDNLSALLGEGDSWSDFDAGTSPSGTPFPTPLPHHVLEARRRNKGLRLPSTGRIVDSLVPTILEQKVTVIEARRGYRYLVRRYGSVAPGPAPEGLLVAPSPTDWLAVPSWEWHKAGVGPQRSATVMRALRSAVALERLALLPSAEASAKLQTIPGVGQWTAAEVLQRTHGCSDSIAVGDYHLAKFVGFALTGQRTDDAGMLALLEPWRGHRQRVVRLLGLTGARAPRFGARMSIQDHRGH